MKTEVIPFGKNPGRPSPDHKVRTCRNPDAVCLQSGCMYCHLGPWKTVKSLEAYAIRNGLHADFEYGWRYGWPNYPMRKPVS